ncbi:MAG: aminodeoxychorismate synthase component I [Bacteroidales bacterium]|nr:aminodeoxychorismate synthase component I [Bacteroidales bacterium]
MNKKEAEIKMNKLGENKTPFLFIIDFEMQNSIVLPLNKLIKNNIFYSFNEKTNFRTIKSVADFSFSAEKLKFNTYKKSFDFVMQNILKGNSYLVNLTAQTKIFSTYNLLELFYLSRAKYKLYYDDNFIFFSPETFIQITDNQIFSFPMKGTINANILNAEKIILSDEKETAEHYTIVDLIRNDLNIVAKNVKVDKFRYIDKILTSNKNLLQVSSKISGFLDKNFSNKIGDIIFSLLPAGSVSGAPKKKTVEIILDAETYKRGFYTGVAGIFDGRNVDSCVMIRFIQKNNGNLYYKSGGGITSTSKLENEYNELNDKIYIPF